MGANFQTMTLPGDKTKGTVREAFRVAQVNDRYESGHSYSGGFGMASGLRFDDREFVDEKAAIEFLEENCVKWEEARAVIFKNNNGTLTWLIGAWCSS